MNKTWIQYLRTAATLMVVLTLSSSLTGCLGGQKEPKLFESKEDFIEAIVNGNEIAGVKTELYYLNKRVEEINDKLKTKLKIKEKEELDKELERRNKRIAEEKKRLEGLRKKLNNPEKGDKQ